MNDAIVRHPVAVVVVDDPVMLEAALAVRRHVFCEEQCLFDGSDRDGHDSHAVHLAALVGGEVVGTVRLYESGAGVWMGGRLAVLPGSRGGTGMWLVRRAVEEARRQGASRFLAKVQAQNERFFQRLGWATVGQSDEVRGVPHVLMEAPLWTEAECRKIS